MFKRGYPSGGYAIIDLGGVTMADGDSVKVAGAYDKVTSKKPIMVTGLTLGDMAVCDYVQPVISSGVYGFTVGAWTINIADDDTVSCHDGIIGGNGGGGGDTVATLTATCVAMPTGGQYTTVTLSDVVLPTLTDGQRVKVVITDGGSNKWIGYGTAEFINNVLGCIRNVTLSGEYMTMSEFVTANIDTATNYMYAATSTFTS